MKRAIKIQIQIFQIVFGTYTWHFPVNAAEHHRRSPDSFSKEKYPKSFTLKGLRNRLTLKGLTESCSDASFPKAFVRFMSQRLHGSFTERQI